MRASVLTHPGQAVPARRLRGLRRRRQWRRQSGPRRVLRFAHEPHSTSGALAATVWRPAGPSLAHRRVACFSSTRSIWVWRRTRVSSTIWRAERGV